MALSDGFFNSELVNGEYDRLYNADHHMEYYGYFIGSGVCIANNSDSFKVTYDTTTRVATVAPGYLFINGYWLKNTADYDIQLPSTGIYAIVAKLDYTSRNITLAYAAEAQTYPNSLALAIIDVSSGSCTDNRSNVDTCGVIDSAGNSSSKAQSAKDYIDNEVDDRLDEVEAGMNAAVAALNAKEEEVQELLDILGYPAIGEVKFTKATLSNKWLACNGQYISASAYPELVELLGSSSIGSSITSKYKASETRYISNGVLYDGYVYFINWVTKTLEGIELSGNGTRSIDISSMLDFTVTSTFMDPTASRPICLSISNGNIFIAQNISSNAFVIAAALFSGTAISTVLRNSDMYLSGLDTGSKSKAVPYIKTSSASSQWWLCRNADVLSTTDYSYTTTYQVCTKSISELKDIVDAHSASQTARYYSSIVANKYYNNHTDSWPYSSCTKCAFNPKNSDEMVIATSVYGVYESGTGGVGVIKYATQYKTTISSVTNGLYESTPTDASGDSADSYALLSDTTVLPVASADYVIVSICISTTQSMVIVADILHSVTYNVDITSVIPSGCKVFMESVCYGKNMFWIMLSTGILTTTDPTDASTYSYVSFTDSIGTISNFGYLNYDSTNDQLVLLGVDNNNTTKLCFIDTSGVVASDTGAYLPSLSRGGVQGYIKALAG